MGARQNNKPDDSQAIRLVGYDVDDTLIKLETNQVLNLPEIRSLMGFAQASGVTQGIITNRTVGLDAEEPTPVAKLLAKLEGTGIKFNNNYVFLSSPQVQQSIHNADVKYNEKFSQNKEKLDQKLEGHVAGKNNQLRTLRRKVAESKQGEKLKKHQVMIVDDGRRIVEYANKIGFVGIKAPDPKETSKAYLKEMADKLGLIDYAKKLIDNPQACQHDSSEKKASALFFVNSIADDVPELVKLREQADAKYHQFDRSTRLDLRRLQKTTKNFTLEGEQTQFYSQSDALIDSMKDLFATGVSWLTEVINTSQKERNNHKEAKQFLQKEARPMTVYLRGAQTFLNSNPLDYDKNGALKNLHVVAETRRQYAVQWQEVLLEKLGKLNYSAADLKQASVTSLRKEVLPRAYTGTASRLLQYYLRFRELQEGLTEKWVENPEVKCRITIKDDSSQEAFLAREQRKINQKKSSQEGLSKAHAETLPSSKKACQTGLGLIHRPVQPLLRSPTAPTRAA